jgi:hypothetical protein
MALKAVVTNPACAVAMDAAVLDGLQWQQFQHDEKYHREIARLTVQDRLKHMALHFAKYAGQLYAGPSESEFRRLATDVLIIGISTANILNLRLADVLGSTNASDGWAFDRCLVVAAGQMAEACEKMDHMEDFAYRPRISAQTIKIINSVLALFVENNWDVGNSIETRLAPVKAKSIFHGKL